MRSDDTRDPVDALCRCSGLHRSKGLLHVKHMGLKDWETIRAMSRLFEFRPRPTQFGRYLGHAANKCCVGLGEKREPRGETTTPRRRSWNALRH